MSFIRNVALSAAIVAVSAVSAIAQSQIFRITLDTGPNHIRNISMENFITLLNERAGDRLDVQVFPSAQLFKANDVAKALAQGAVEMGVPVIIRLARVVPNAGVIDLPMFYGLPAEDMYKVMDGEVGQALNAEIAETMDVHVLGPNLDLGHISIFTTETPITQLSDLDGLKLRVPGGPAAAARYEALGVTAVSMAFGDVPLALSQGSLDGLVTTHESIRSVKLWESGLEYALDTQGVFIQYVPLVSKSIWDSYDVELQGIITQAWLDSVDGARQAASARQEEAKAELIENGVTVTSASVADLAAFRETLLANQDEIIEATRIDADFAASVQAVLAE